MTKSKSTTSRLTNLVMSTLVMFLNPAPLVEGAPEGSMNRENTPWYVSVPALGVSVMARDNSGNPIVGYWQDSEAIAYAMGLYSQAVADPELLATLRAHPEWPTDIDARFKMMTRPISVPRPI